MERTQLLDLMSELELYGIKAAFDEIIASADTPARTPAYCRRPIQRLDQREAGYRAPAADPRADALSCKAFLSGSTWSQPKPFLSGSLSTR